MGVKTIAEIKGAVRQINIGDMSIEDLENLTPVDSVNFSKRNFSEEQIEDINQRTVVNHLRNAKYIIFDRKNYVRYCEANPKVIWEKIEWVLKCEDKYFNAHSLWNRLSESGFSEKLQNNEWMCTCIFRQQEAIASLQVAGGIILCREYSELNFGLICKWLVEKNGRMTIQNLTLLFNDTFSTRVLVSKIAEKMKAYGLWEAFVTDSFEEYIDNLVVNTDLELDDNDLFQEEFF